MCRGYSDDLILGYNIDKSFDFQLELEQVVFTGQSSTHNDYRELIEIKYVFDGPDWQPYLLLGSNWLTLAGAFVSGSTSPNFNAIGGVGVQCSRSFICHNAISFAFYAGNSV